jgi:hypothetical protein
MGSQFQAAPDTGASMRSNLARASRLVSVSCGRASVEADDVRRKDIKFQASSQRLMFNLIAGEGPRSALGLIPAGKNVASVHQHVHRSAPNTK